MATIIPNQTEELKTKILTEGFTPENTAALVNFLNGLQTIINKNPAKNGTEDEILFMPIGDIDCNYAAAIEAKETLQSIINDKIRTQLLYLKTVLGTGTGPGTHTLSELTIIITTLLGIKLIKNIESD